LGGVIKGYGKLLKTVVGLLRSGTVIGLALRPVAHNQILRYNQILHHDQIAHNQFMRHGP
jgi:hypothetical protein